MAAANAVPPHIVFFLVDDLGYAGVGFNSPLGEPKTPHIDALAAEGAVLTRHYTYTSCAPSRSSFISGRLPIHVNQKNGGPCSRGYGVPPNMTTIGTLLHRAGYATHHAGKWHAGMSQGAQLPINRGFDSSLAMLSGQADHFTSKQLCGAGEFVDLWLNSAPARGLNGTYSELLYVNHMLSAIQAHNASQPLFLFMAFQNPHNPLQAPDRFLDLYNDSIYVLRRKGLAQISTVDEGVANITKMLKAKGMWENTLVIFSSDNGGPSSHENNFPLRGAKGSDFEGGVRAVAFVSGGWLPSHMRGSKITGMMAIADWYATFASLAGADPHDKAAEEAGLPPIDSLDMLLMLTGQNGTSPRTEMPLSYVSMHRNHPWGAKGLIAGSYKLIISSDPNLPESALIPGHTTPNGTSYVSNVDCSAGCLFDLFEDEIEHHDLSKEKPELLNSLRSRLEEIGVTAYQSPGGYESTYTTYNDTISTIQRTYNGFWGPSEGPGFVDTEAVAWVGTKDHDGPIAFRETSDCHKPQLSCLTVPPSFHYPLGTHPR